MLEYQSHKKPGLTGENKTWQNQAQIPGNQWTPQENQCFFEEAIDFPIEIKEFSRIEWFPKGNQCVSKEINAVLKDINAF